MKLAALAFNHFK